MTDIQSQSHADRVYDWWSDHLGLYALFTRTAFFGRTPEFRHLAVERLSLSPGDRALDLACGAGPNLERLVGAVGSSGAVLGLDHSRGMVAAARDRIRDNGYEAGVLRGDAARLPLATDAVDGVLCTLALSAIPDHRAAIEEVRRVLRPEGRFVVVDAQPFQRGPGRLLNPLINRISTFATNWYPERDLPAALREAFGAGAVDVDLYNGGTAFVATARMPE